MTEDEESLKLLRGLIRYWENKLKSMKAYLAPAEEALVRSTIIQLKRLEKLDID